MSYEMIMKEALLLKIAVYSRKSKFSDRGESIKNQIEMCRNYASDNFNASEGDITVYEDEGFSGGTTDRPEFQRMLRDISVGKYGALICYRLDRISRNVLDFSNILEILSKTNTSFVSITERFDTSTPMGRAMVNIAAVFAQLERETIAERLRDNIRSLALTGRYLGSTPAFGFLAERIEYTDPNGKKKKMRQLSPDAEKMKYVNIIYDKYTELKSLSKLEAFLMQNSLVNGNGNYSGSSELRRILSNPVYVRADEKVHDYFMRRGSSLVNGKEEFNGENGMLVYGKHYRGGAAGDPSKWTVVIAGHKGVISSGKWLAVQLLLEKNRRAAPRAGTSSTALLSSKIKCAGCGATMIVIYGKNKSLHYYKCKTKIQSRKKLCDMKNISGQTADRKIIEFLKELPENRKGAYAIIDGQKNRRQLETKKARADMRTAENVISQKEREIKSLTAQLRNNFESKAAKYIISDIENLDKEIQTLKSILPDNQEKENIPSQEAINNFVNSAENWTLELKRQYIDKIIDSIKWNGVNLTVRLK